LKKSGKTFNSDIDFKRKVLIAKDSRKNRKAQEENNQGSGKKRVNCPTNGDREAETRKLIKIAKRN